MYETGLWCLLLTGASPVPTSLPCISSSIIEHIRHTAKVVDLIAMALPAKAISHSPPGPLNTYVAGNKVDGPADGWKVPADLVQFL